MAYLKPEWVLEKIKGLEMCPHGPLKVAETKNGQNAGRWYAACSAPRDDPSKCKGMFNWLDEDGDNAPNKRPRTSNHGSNFSGSNFGRPGNTAKDLTEIKGTLEDLRNMLAQMNNRLDALVAANAMKESSE